MPVGMSYLSTCTFYSKSFWCQLKSSLYSFSLFVPNFKYTSCAYICIMYHVYLYYANTWRSTCQPIYFLSHFILHCILYLVFCIYFVCFVFLCSYSYLVFCTFDVLYYISNICICIMCQHLAFHLPANLLSISFHIALYLVICNFLGVL